MLFYLQSTDPNDYSTVKFYANPPLGKGPLRFRINQLNTIASFMVTTHDDYVTFNIDGEIVKVYFKDKREYDKDTLDTEIKKVLPENVEINFNDQGTFTVTAYKPFSIVDASHRAKLLLGLYHTQLPLIAKKHSEDINVYEIIIQSVPYHCLGNTLYLRSKISSVVGFNDKDNKDVYLSICYHVFELFVPNIPIITRIPGATTRILPSDLTNLEFTLVDFQNEPVILNAPLRLVMEVMYD